MFPDQSKALGGMKTSIASSVGRCEAPKVLREPHECGLGGLPPVVVKPFGRLWLGPFTTNGPNFGWCVTQPNSLSQFRSCYCSRPESYCHSLDRADNPTCPDCYASDCGGPRLQLAHISNGPGPVRYVGSTSPGRVITGESPAVFPIFLQCRSTLTPFLPNPHARRGPSPIFGPRRDHFIYPSLHLMSFHPLVRRSTPSSAIYTQQQQRTTSQLVTCGPRPLHILLIKKD